MGTEATRSDRNSTEYLTQLLKDKKQLQALPNNIFVHADKLLDEEINRVRQALFHTQEKKHLTLPDAQGAIVSLQEKIYVPVKDFPEFNFVGRILGPRGMTAKEMEQYTGCKIMVRGRGSMRDRIKEEQNRGRPNWEHLSEDLHVLITVEDTQARAEMKLEKAKEEVQRLLMPAPDGEDELKKKQLLELAILNGTYHDQKPLTVYQPYMPPPQRFLTPHFQLPIRAAAPSAAGAPIILAPPRLQSPMVPLTVPNTGIINGAPPPPLVSPQANGGIFYSPYENPVQYGLTAAPTTILDYQQIDPTGGVGAVPKVRRALVGAREHPYNRGPIN